MTDFLHPFKKLIPSGLKRQLRNAVVSLKHWFNNDYSQAGETKAIIKLLQKGKNQTGFFIEIGANDGFTFSATYGLVKKGWSGLSVEANPLVYNKLNQNLHRFTKIKTVHAAVAQASQPVKLFLGNNDPQGLYSTLCNDQNEWFAEHRSEHFIEVPGITLSELLDKNAVPTLPDLLLIDAEGMDLEVLQTLDFIKYRPRLIVTEDYAPKNEVKSKLLRAHGYRFEQQVGCNGFWLDREL